MSSIRPAVSMQYRLVTDRRSDGQTQSHGWYHASTASRGNEGCLHYVAVNGWRHRRTARKGPFTPSASTSVYVRRRASTHVDGRRRARCEWALIASVAATSVLRYGLIIAEAVAPHAVVTGAVIPDVRNDTKTHCRWTRIVQRIVATQCRMILSALHLTFCSFIFSCSIPLFYGESKDDHQHAGDHPDRDEDPDDCHCDRGLTESFCARRVWRSRTACHHCSHHTQPCRTL